MSTIKAPNGREFRIERSMINVTSMSRPNTSWMWPDGHGHWHSWWAEGKPITDGEYHPSVKYELPTLKQVDDGVESFDDGDGCFDEVRTSHYECVQCGEHVVPGSCGDTSQQFIPGLVRHYVDDRIVGRDEFLRLAKDAFPDADWTKVE